MRMEKMLGTEYGDLLASMTGERDRALCVDLMKADPVKLKDAVPFTLEPVPWCRNGFFYSVEDQPGKHPLHEAGAYYIQEPSAMTAGQLLSPQRGERVLDLCAAPGGKTLAARLSADHPGLFAANEINPQRARVLAQNAERLGLYDVIVTNEPPAALADRFPAFFDRILVDAPCSGEGMFRKEPEAVRQWTPDLVRECAIRQEQILECALRMLAPGGRLVYSTCTFAPDEDEYQVLRMLQKDPELHTLDAMELLREVSGCDPAACGFVRGSADNLPFMYLEADAACTADEAGALADSVRLFPHRVRGEGHFVAVLERDGIAVNRLTAQRDAAGTGNRSAGPARTGRKGKEGSKGLEEAVRLWQEFAASHITADGFARIAPPESTAYLLYGEMLYVMPAGLSISGLKVIKPGLCLGSVRKGRFEPDHALFMSLRPEEYRYRVPLGADSYEARAFLRGETVSAEPETETAAASGRWENGTDRAKPDWVMILIGGVPAGCGKYDRGMIKNHYPKGLRRSL